MELPEIARKTGIIDNNRIVYIEDYVLQYLEILKQKEEVKEDKYLLYGKKLNVSEREVYVIYGVCRPEEGKPAYFKEAGKDYELVGRLDMEDRESCGRILVGSQNGGQPVKGYYVFYDADDKMKDCLSRYYEESIKRSRYITGKEQEKAELIALSSEERTEGASLYMWIRIAAIGILIIFCAIAVTTINGYDKISDFVQAVVQTNEMLEEP